MACLGHDKVKLIPEKVINAFVDCPWCRQIKSRFNHQPLPEGILKQRIEEILVSKGLCEPCARQIFAEIKEKNSQRETLPPLISPQSAGKLAVLNI